MARVPPVHDVELWDSKLPTDCAQRLVNLVIQGCIDDGEEFHPVIDLGDVILRVPRASILRELHLSLTTLFALRFTQCLQGLVAWFLVFSPEGGTFPSAPTDTSGRIQSRECLTFANTPLEMSFSDDAPTGHRCTSTRNPP